MIVASIPVYNIHQISCKLDEGIIMMVEFKKNRPLLLAKGACYNGILDVNNMCVIIWFRGREGQLC